MRVLVADDSDLVRLRLVDMLSDLKGIETVCEAKEGLEAIELIRKLRPDVVILDIRMPQKSGIESLKEINQLHPYGSDKETLCRPKIIVLTIYPYPQFKERCIHLGANFFFDKSCEFEKVPSVIEGFIWSSSTQTQLSLKKEGPSIFQNDKSEQP